MNKKQILIVDDEPMMLRILTEALKRNSFAIDTAFNRKTAEEMASKKRYDLVLCDVFLPDTRMLEFVDFLKNIDLDYRIILMSGYLESDGFAEDSDEANTVNTITMNAQRKGVFAILKKPFDMNNLLKKVNEALEE